MKFNYPTAFAASQLEKPAGTSTAGQALSAGLALTAACCTVALLTAGVTPAAAQTYGFGTTQTFESYTPGDKPADWFDAADSWHGQVQVVASGTDSIAAGPSGGSQFAKITPGADDSFLAGLRNGPHGIVGRNFDFPTSGDTFSVFRDIYFQPTTGNHVFWMQSIAADKHTTGYLTETSFRFLTGNDTWKVHIGGGDANGINLDTGAWYTLENIWDRSQPKVQATHNIYDASGALLFTETLTNVWLDPDSSDLGGPRNHSWFTQWSNAGPDAVYADNFGTVPEPATLALLALGGIPLLHRRRRLA